MHDLIYLCKNKSKSFPVLSLEGIHRKNFLKFAENYLNRLVPSEVRQTILDQLNNDFDHLYRYLGKAMNSPLTLQNIIFWKACQFLVNKSSNKIITNTAQLSPLGEIMEALIIVKTDITQQRFSNENFRMEIIEKIINDFLQYINANISDKFNNMDKYNHINQKWDSSGNSEIKIEEHIIKVEPGDDHYLADQLVSHQRTHNGDGLIKCNLRKLIL